jgi:hypothetical protein
MSIKGGRIEQTASEQPEILGASLMLEKGENHMKLIKLVKYLPDTANTNEHASAVRLKELLDSLAKSESTSVSLFDVSLHGIAVFGLADDKAVEKIAEQFRADKDVEVSETTMISFQREMNRAAQVKVDKMRAERAKKKS